MVLSFIGLLMDSVGFWMQRTFLAFCSLLFFVFAPSFVFGQSEKDTKHGVNFPTAAQFSNTKLSYKIIPAANNTFCYDVLVDGKILIHQPSKPGLPGNEGFKTKQDAEKVAKLIISKIKKGEMPPSVTTDELKKLNVL